jgi:histidine ammonia-lyase
MLDRRVVLDGESLTRADVVAVAREGALVNPSQAALERVRAARATVEAALAADEPVYGLTTGVGVRKRVRLEGAELALFHRRFLDEHRVAQGPALSHDVVRAALVCVVNGLLRGYSGVRPTLVARLVDALAEDLRPLVRRYGSIGISDLGPLADLAAAVVPPLLLEAGEGLALVNNNAVSTGQAALAVADAERLLDTLGTAAALELEAFAANASPLHPAVEVARPHPGLAYELRRLRAALAGGPLEAQRAARNLQDPLTFRGAGAVLGAARGAFEHVDAVLAVELNAAQQNPLVVVAENRIISVAAYETLPLAAGLDYLRLALAPALTAANERVLKLLQAPLSGLTDGLAAAGFEHESALSEFAWTAQELAVEGRLLAQPVSVEAPSATQAEGIEDRGTFAPLAARRLAEQVEVGERLVAVAFTVASQAVELRYGSGAPTLGAPLRAILAAVRTVVPFVGHGQTLSPDLEPLVELVRSGALRDPVVLAGGAHPAG